MAGIYNGHILEFPLVRVDCFTSPPSAPNPPWLLPHPSNLSKSWTPAPNAQLFLLTHVHSDHLTGLSNDFTGKIVCTPDTKRMLLKLEAEIERGGVEEGWREGKRRKYSGLARRVARDERGRERVVDRIEAVPYGDPRTFELGYEDGRPVKVTITLLDANHCPGSAMFLITSKDKAVLHTGDLRADSPWVSALRNNPAVGEFIEPWSIVSTKGEGPGRRRLDRMYIDTGAVLGTGDMPDRESVLKDMIQQMSLYPEDTVFFLNVWCFGWEHVVKEVARHFQQPVHIDRYKHSIYSAIETDPFLLACTTQDPNVSRFHACERRYRCETCRTFDRSGKRGYNLDKRIVSVNMVEIKTAGWEVQRQAFLDALGRAAIGEGNWPFRIDCPIARHSPLPELQALVKLFRPFSLSPNTMLPDADGLDYYLLAELFADSLPKGGFETIIAERSAWFAANARYGQAYLDQKAALRGAGVDLMVPLDQQSSPVIGRLPDDNDQKDLVSRARMPAGKRANARDQAFRAGQVNLTDTNLFNLQHSQTTDSRVQFGIFRQTSLQVTAPFAAYGQPKYEDDEYDTDEEEDRRKRPRIACTAAPSSSGRSSRPVDNPLASPVTSLHTGHLDAPPYTRPTTEIEPIYERTIQSPAAIKRETISTQSFRTRPRFMVDKDHLRALAMVCADPEHG